MKLFEDGVPINYLPDASNSGGYDSDSSDFEEPEPVSATLVLHVMNEDAQPPESSSNNHQTPLKVYSIHTLA